MGTTMQELEIGAVIMVGSGGTSPQEQLVLAAQRASTLDLIGTLHSQGVQRIVVAAPTLEWLPANLGVIIDEDQQDERFHFGQRLAALIERYGLEPVMYFGGGSAPLVDASVTGMITGLLDRAVNGGIADPPPLFTSKKPQFQDLGPGRPGRGALAGLSHGHPHKRFG